MARQLFPMKGDGADAGEPGIRRISLVRLSAEIARQVALIGGVAVEGEVHRAAHRPGGRTYFTLRDRAAQLGVTCPANRARHCRVVDGERVLVTGRLVYGNERGQLLLEAEEVVPVGAGAIAALVAEARERLRADGLLDRPRRRLPLLPAAIGVVCGFDAAVRADIESVVAARFPGYPLRFAEVTVSGSGAADAIAGALQALDHDPAIEVIVLARGGGDPVQLLPFSDEVLCRAICRCHTAVVSAIGHEGDRPLCDEVADARYGTPSLAADAVVPNRSAILSWLDELAERRAAAMTARVDRCRGRLDAVDRQRALAAAQQVAAARLTTATRRLALVHPGSRLRAGRERLAAHRARLEALSPRRVLERGYAVVRGPDGAVVRDAATLHAGDSVEIDVATGRVRARVEEVEGG